MITSIYVPRPLTAKQARFVAEYLVDANATRAAIRAGYSEKSAGDYACQLLRKTQVREAVNEQRRAQAARTRITADRVLHELARIGFVDIGDVASWGESGAVQVVPSEDMTADHRAALSEVTFTETGGGTTRNGDERERVVTVRVKMHDKAKALGLLCKHLGLLKE